MARSPEEKKAAQAAAHKRWRQTPKYAEYKARQKARKEAKKNDENSPSPQQQ